MKITLIGYMGCGKTTIGKNLSKKLNYKFYDLDDIIIKYKNNSIENIFNIYGESYFRKLENFLLKNFLKKNINQWILSVGGGSPCFYNNIYLLNKFSKTIYLKSDSYTLLKRLILEKKNRPLISNLDNVSLFKFIINSLSRRIFFYEKSYKKIIIKNKCINEIIQDIINSLDLNKY
ncbi:shikimate kinase [Blattabacterium cuenoti]|uniref:shikimate kinase n=1 Tax=Blattabacterium cuenoti TaxID=1653831 RepID=UPI00163C0C02|nr:shikimate kinase [Blattabacterium cuenoti]